MWGGTVRPLDITDNILHTKYRGYIPQDTTDNITQPD